VVRFMPRPLYPKKGISEPSVYNCSVTPLLLIISVKISDRRNSNRAPRSVTGDLTGTMTFLAHFIFVQVKGKVVPVLSLTERHAMKTYLGSGRIAPRIL
jgi:hypothetical protein